MLLLDGPRGPRQQDSYRAARLLPGAGGLQGPPEGAGQGRECQGHSSGPPGTACSCHHRPLRATPVPGPGDWARQGPTRRWRRPPLREGPAADTEAPHMCKTHLVKINTGSVFPNKKRKQTNNKKKPNSNCFLKNRTENTSLSLSQDQERDEILVYTIHCCMLPENNTFH